MINTKKNCDHYHQQTYLLDLDLEYLLNLCRVCAPYVQQTKVINADIRENKDKKAASIQ